jgi:hypothetical protein
LGPAGKDTLNAIPKLSGFISNIDDKKPKKQIIPSMASSKAYRKFISVFGASSTYTSNNIYTLPSLP